MEPQVYITSLNQKLFEDYGKNFVESWLANAALDLVLIVVHEEQKADYLAPYSSGNVISLPLASEEYALFKKKFGRFTEAAGFSLIPLDQAQNSYQLNYNYRFDALRFSFKIFSLMKVLRTGLVTNEFAWIDADIICRQPFSADQMRPMFPEVGQIASYLGRTSFPQPNPHSECGFVGYRLDNSSVVEFLEDFERLYIEGSIFQLTEWHDSYIFDVLRIKYESMGHEFKNLVAGLPESEHPFMSSKLAEMFDHLKGPDRKKRGFS